MEIKKFSRKDFLDGMEPYEYLYSFQHDSFMLERVMVTILDNAREQGIKNFKKLFGEYVKSVNNQKKIIYSNSVTQFEGQELELETGNWRADEKGVSTDGVFGEVIACAHPIMPIERLINIDTGIEKMKIAYRKSRQWRSLIVDKKTLASSSNIVNLADSGIGVTSENAKYLVKYLSEVEHLNYESIPEKNSVTRLGWIDGEGFSPYVNNLVFDGEQTLKPFFDSVKKSGTFEEWKKAAIETRKNIISRIILAASFASVLVKPMNCLPFFVHLWGGTEVGKTVALMVSASVWANPEMGKYIHTFNSTLVGRERSAAFVNSLPLIMDELQIIKDKTQFDHDIYTLAEGVGRSRGNKYGGLDKTPTWANCIITSGEMPITSNNSGGGAVNRIIEIECKESLFENGRDICNVIKRNYGHAGKLFVEYLNQENAFLEVEKIFLKYNSELSKSERTEKQSISGALVLTADHFITNMFFPNDEPLTSCQIKNFLQTKESVSSHEKGYKYLCGWVVENSNRFEGYRSPDNGQIYGRIEGDYAYIINTVFYKVCEEAGFNATALLSYLKQHKLIDAGDKITKCKRINKIQTRCIFLKLPTEGDLIFE